ncbi:chaperonin 10-like protein [Mycena filopes]|nr:chaperonin 10-like protein [Mycena filopes]
MSIESTVFKGGPDGIVQATSRLDAPTGSQVLVRITHSGICGTDEHFKTRNLVLGHEGVGTVETVGPAVVELKKGDVVGWGYTHKACGRCPQVYGGSFGSHAVWEEAFLFKIPGGACARRCRPPHVCRLLPSSTLSIPTTSDPTDRVGVIGMGASVIVFSSTDSKREESMNFGATEFFATKGVAVFETAPIDHLIVTTSFQPEWKPILKIMKPTGVIYALTVDSGNLNIPVTPVVSWGLTIQGASVASRSVNRKMLEFAARHQIKPVIERFPLTKTGVEEGMA